MNKYINNELRVASSTESIALISGELAYPDGSTIKLNDVSGFVVPNNGASGEIQVGLVLVFRSNGEEKRATLAQLRITVADNICGCRLQTECRT